MHGPHQPAQNRRLKIVVLSIFVIRRFLRGFRQSGHKHNVLDFGCADGIFASCITHGLIKL